MSSSSKYAQKRRAFLSGRSKVIHVCGIIACGGRSLGTRLKGVVVHFHMHLFCYVTVYMYSYIRMVLKWREDTSQPLPLQFSACCFEERKQRFTFLPKGVIGENII